MLLVLNPGTPLIPPGIGRGALSRRHKAKQKTKIFPKF